jgi:hypothetical protein
VTKGTAKVVDVLAILEACSIAAAELTEEVDR